MTAITYDGKNVELQYDDNGYLIKIGNSEVNLEEYPEIENLFFTSLIYDGDTDTYTTTDINGNEHTFSILTTDDTITGAIYDGKTISLTTDAEGNIIKVGNSTVDVSEYEGSSGGGSNYKSITENQDGTFTVVDTDNVSHIISITETDGTISATLDGKAIPITLDTNGNIVKIGNSDISISEQSEGKGGYGGVAVIPIQSIAEAMPTSTTVTV
jgi:hypothetical protein